MNIQDKIARTATKAMVMVGTAAILGIYAIAITVATVTVAYDDLTHRRPKPPIRSV
jgi:hypothetical protein